MPRKRRGALRRTEQLDTVADIFGSVPARRRRHRRAARDTESGAALQGHYDDGLRRLEPYRKGHPAGRLQLPRQAVPARRGYEHGGARLRVDTLPKPHSARLLRQQSARFVAGYDEDYRSAAQGRSVSGYDGASDRGERHGQGGRGADASQRVEVQGRVRRGQLLRDT